MHAFLIAAIVITAVAAVTDARKGTIPNWLTLPALALGPFAHAAHGYAVGGTRDALFLGIAAVAGALVCGFVPWIAFRFGSMGGGDVKLLAAVGALCMPAVGIEAEAYGMLAATVLVLGQMAFRGVLFRTLKNVAILLLNLVLPRSRRREVESSTIAWVRLGPAFCIGTTLAVAVNWS